MLPNPDSARQTLLLVDDEPTLLKALQRELRTEPYAILSADNGEEALALLAQHEVQVILSDYRMPGMNGVEFLVAARQLRPDAVRMVLSGYADIEAVISAINRGHIYKFLNKPCERNELRHAIAEAFARYALLRRSAQFSSIFEHTSEGIFILDTAGGIEAVNPAFVVISGYPPSEIIGLHHAILFAEPTLESGLLERLAGSSGHWSGEIWLRRQQGEIFPAMVKLSEIRDDNGSLRQIVGLCADITERKQREIALLESEKRFRDFMEFAPVGMLIVNLDGRLVKVNQALCQILRYPRETLESLSVEDLTPADDLPADLARWRQLQDGSLPVWQAEKRYRRSDGSLVWVQLTASVLRDTRGIAQCFDVQVEDISERRQHQEQIRQLAYFDALTGLPNRRLLQEKLDEALLRSRQNSHPLAVIFLDLDHFKQVNDVHGHEAGDELLILAARRLTQCVRRADTVARQGGDEFIVILAELSDPHDADRVADKIIASLSQPYELPTSGARITEITASLGIALYPEHGSDAPTLMKNADQAMYAAKEAGRNAYRVFTTGIAPA